MSDVIQRMVGAAKLDRATFEDVEADGTATAQALTVVSMSSIAAGVGNGVTSGSALLVTALAALVGWFLWASLIYLIGTKVLSAPETKSDVGELLRTTGFASAPGVLRVFGLIEGYGPVLIGVANVWMLVAMVVGVKQALDYDSTARAIGVCLVGWIVMVGVTVLVAGASA
jgi:hypothetical protein